VSPLKDKEFQDSMIRISRLATELYGLMEHGTTIDVTFPEYRPPRAALKEMKPNRLIVTKPGDHMAITAKVGVLAAVSPPVTTRRRK